MLTNNQMTEGRFLKLLDARRRVAWIKDHLEAGRTVYVCTYTRATKCSKKHADMFKATKGGAYMQSGKSWVNIDYCKLEAR